METNHRREDSVSPKHLTPQPGTPVNGEPIGSSPTSNPPTVLLRSPTFQNKDGAESLTLNQAAPDSRNRAKGHDDLPPAVQANGSILSEPKDDIPHVSSADRQPKNQNDVVTSEDQDGAPYTAGRSVQFASQDPQMLSSPTPSHSRHGSWDGPETPGKHRGSSIMSKIKALAATPTTPSLKSPPALITDEGSQSAANSPTTSRFGSRVPDTLEEVPSDVDADFEETADEDAIPNKNTSTKKKRKMRRFKKGHVSTPSTPIRLASDVDTWGAYNRLLRRRASMPDTSNPEPAERGMSEGEARDRLTRRPFLRGHSFMGTTMGGTPPNEELDDMESSAAVGRRTGHLRRITVFGGGGVSDGDAMVPRRPFFNTERASNFGAQKWRQVKSTLKLIRKKEDHFDYFKSAELMAELRAGAPAVLMLASMIQRDEHGNKRIPVLLEQLKLKIKDSSPMPDDEKGRHWMFTMALEYGSGPSQMSWSVTRNITEIYNLHFRYKFALNNDKYMLGRDLGARPKQPKFPYSAFPYLRRARDKGDVSDDDDQASVHADETGGEDLPDGVVSGTDGPHQPKRRKSRANLWGMRRRSTGFTDPGETSEGPNTSAVDAMTRKQRYVEKQRRVLEKYLSEMIRWLMFRADSNRLCRFLELSALGVRLAAEGSYHGKEGYLHIQSSKGLDFRRVLTPAKVISRHSRKWFLVRQSYIVCVESPENMNIYDVYLVDNKFAIKSKKNSLKQLGSKGKKKEIDLTVDRTVKKHHTLTLHTSERKVRFFSSDHSTMKEFEVSINEMLKRTVWYETKRFDSFAPVRQNVSAQWLVDGRDYMWNVSRAINLAKDVIYIHDWWLSPELYLRRPACISQKWRLDRLLKRKAEEGVKIFIIIYRNVEAAIPIDSEYTKFSLLNLHPNIFVQRSPNQFKKNQFFFAHHEKICIVDHDMAFLGGVDLCFGRWDSPQHPIVDDRPTGFEMSEGPRDAEHCQLFPGKDYSNPRVQDFYRLNEPYEEMYDRSKVPRMPWHDVAMQVVGQPARDLTRHFIQRWNYLRRGRKPTRPLPFLLPPPDAKLEELKSQGLTGTCEVQMLRSASTWSLGLEETEHSIHNAYIKMIEDSEHFVYMENQFFITSTEAYGTRIVNGIGDALVDRIIRANENGEDWRCVIMIPLMPGFQNTVDEQEGTSVRLIIMCQYRSICRGENSIFGRLRAEGIEPEDYIGFYCLRQWGVMNNGALTTEQLYIHAKTIIVDDRVALIGSANINERSMLGTRDSECAAIVRDTDMIWSTMAGQPYQVGRFAHTLRLRLMREHLGLDVDEILHQERQQGMDREAFEQQMEEIYFQDNKIGQSTSQPNYFVNQRRMSFNHELDMEKAKAIGDQASSSSSSASSSAESHSDAEPGPSRVSGSRRNSQQQNKSQQLDVSGYGQDHWKAAEKSGHDEGRDSVVVRGREVLLHNIDTEGKGTISSPKEPHRSDPTPENRYLDPAGMGNKGLPPMPPLNRRTTEQLGLMRPAQLPPLPVADDSDIGGPPAHIDPVSGRPKSGAFHPMTADIKSADISKDCMRDPLLSSFIDDVWNRAAHNNTKLYRRVFRCMPDSEVRTWQEYREWMDYSVKFQASMYDKADGSESDLKLETTHQTNVTAGAGIGAPGPEAIAAAAHVMTDEPQGKSSQSGHATMEKPRSKLDVTEPEGEEKQMNEKSSPGAESTFAFPSLLPTVDENALHTLDTTHTKGLESQTSRNTDRKTTFSAPDMTSLRETTSSNSGLPAQAQFGSVKRRRRATTKGSRRGFSIDDMPSREDGEEMLKMIQGNIVQFPYDWLVTEEQNGNWGFQVDGVAPLTIYD